MCSDTVTVDIYFDVAPQSHNTTRESMPSQ